MQTKPLLTTFGVQGHAANLSVTTGVSRSERFVATEAAADAICAALNQNGAFAAAVELRWHFLASPTDAFGNR